MDCISRQAVLEGVDTYINKAQSKGTQDDFNSFAELVVKVLPPVNPQPKTGKWIFKKFDEETGISNSYWCSACNYPMAQVYDDYCAHCGAKMEREGGRVND